MRERYHLASRGLRAEAHQVRNEARRRRINLVLGLFWLIINEPPPAFAAEQSTGGRDPYAGVVGLVALPSRVSRPNTMS